MDNYTIIAGNTTSFFYSLKNHYKKYFDDELSLLVAAATISALNFINEKSISINEIIDIAKKAMSTNDPLLELIINLEIKEFCTEPEFEESEIIDAVMSQKGRIKAKIEQIKSIWNSKDGKKIIEPIVAMAMESEEGEEIRKMLMIKDAKKKSFIEKYWALIAIVIMYLVVAGTMFYSHLLTKETDREIKLRRNINSPRG